MSPAQREKAFKIILRRAVAVGLGVVGQQDIDRTNILRAALGAMVQALSGLEPRPEHALVDGTISLPLDWPQTTMAGGDGKSVSIGAASIVAKVVRDRLMAAYDRVYPAYGFASHKGYGTRRHMEALKAHGPCPLHRLSFRGVGRTG